MNYLESKPLRHLQGHLQTAFIFMSVQRNQDSLNILVETGVSSPSPLPRGEEGLVNTLLSESERSSPKKTVILALLLFNESLG